MRSAPPPPRSVANAGSPLSRDSARSKDNGDNARIKGGADRAPIRVVGNERTEINVDARNMVNAGNGRGELPRLAWSSPRPPCEGA